MIEGFDISNNNDFSLVESYIELENPKFCFMKVSQGTGFKDKVLPEFYHKLIKPKGIVPGLYHFAGSPNNAALEEAQNFIDGMMPYMEDGALLCLDVEANALRCSNNWIRKWIDAVESIVDGKVIIYIQESAFQSKRNAFKDNGLWLASWGADFSKNPVTNGYPIAFHQTGFRHKLDHDVFFGNMEQLNKYRCYLKEDSTKKGCSCNCEVCTQCKS